MAPKQSPKSLIVGTVIAILAVAGLIVFALSNQQQPVAAPAQSQTENEQATPVTEDDSAPAPSDRIVVAFNDAGFEPADFSVKKGTVITVMNRSSRDVQFSSDDHPAHRENSEMNLKRLAPGESAAYTASRVGTWGFHDHIDERKTGTVTVKEE